MSMGIEARITVAIVAVTAVWAGRAIWRAARKRFVEPVDEASPCGGGCGGCPVSPGQRPTGSSCPVTELQDLKPRSRD